jgi:hypothetical protein
LTILYNRFVGKQQYQEAEELLKKAIATMLQYKKCNEAAELGQMLVDIYTKQNEPPANKHIETIVDISEQFDTSNADNLKAKIAYLKSALQ